MPSLFAAFWKRLRHLAERWSSYALASAHRGSLTGSTAESSRLILVHYSWPFDIPANQAFLETLSTQPAWFQRRTVVACVESDVRADIRSRLPRLAATRPSACLHARGGPTNHPAP